MYVRINQHHIKATFEGEFVAAMIAYAHALFAGGFRCQRFDIVRDIDEPGSYYLYEVFPDRDARDRAHFALWRMRDKLCNGRWSEWHTRRVRRLHGCNVSPGNAGMKTPIAAPGKLPAVTRRDKRYLHFGVWQIRPEYVAQFVRAMSANARATVKNEPTCYRFDVIRDLAEPGRFYLYQIYHDQRAHDVLHVRMPHLKKLFGHPAWGRWSDQKSGPVIGLVSETGFSRTIRGIVLWSHDEFETIAGR